MAMATLLSIITVVYNAQSTLQRTIDSVRSQTWTEHIEHVIIDGASTDGTLDILQHYKKSNPKLSISIVSEPDKGLYDAMNKGLHKAKGTYVCFLNAGDKLHDPHTVEQAFVSAGLGTGSETGKDKPQIGIIYGDTDIVDNNGKYLHKRHLNPPEYLTWQSFKQGMLVCHQSFYARRDICCDYDTRYRLSADVDWCIRVMREGERKGLANHYTHTVLTDYLDEGMTTRNHRASLIERFKVMTQHYGLIPTVVRHITFLFR